MAIQPVSVPKAQLLQWLASDKLSPQEQAACHVALLGEEVSGKVVMLVDTTWQPRSGDPLQAYLAQPAVVAWTGKNVFTAAVQRPSVSAGEYAASIRSQALAGKPIERNDRTFSTLNVPGGPRAAVMGQIVVTTTDYRTRNGQTESLLMTEDANRVSHFYIGTLRASTYDEKLKGKADDVYDKFFPLPDDLDRQRFHTGVVLDPP